MKVDIALVYILISVIAGALGQILFKKGMGSIGPLTLTPDQFLIILWKMATNPYVVIGLVAYAGSTIFWLTALSRLDLSYVYPFASLSYILMLFASFFLFKENISLVRVVGTIVVGIGIFIISRS